MNGHLKDAAHQLNVGATACHYLATSINSSLPTTSPHPPQAVAKLNDTQRSALKSLALGEGRYERVQQQGRSVTRVAAKDGTRISLATFRTLARHGLVTTDTSTPLRVGQAITVTEQGQRALVQSRPTATLTTTAVPTPKTSATPAVRR
ncbi:hypothetical protein [Streptomyces sp. NPDC003006]